MRISGVGVATGLVLATLLTGCAGRSDSLMSVWNDPWPRHGQVLDVRIYPRDTGDGDYLVCVSPCLNRAPSDMGNTWVLPTDPQAFKGWNGTRAVRLRVRIDASSYGPDGVAGHLPLWLEEVSPAPAATAP